jgi:hypothetical protein
MYVYNTQICKDYWLLDLIMEYCARTQGFGMTKNVFLFGKSSALTQIPISHYRVVDPFSAHNLCKRLETSPTT